MGKNDKDIGRQLTVDQVLDLHAGTEADEGPDIAAKQTVRKGIAVDTVPYLTEMIEEARRSGRPLEDVLAEDLESPAAAAARTPVCLQPSEVVQAVSGSLEATRTEHLAGCIYCRVQVQIAVPKPEEFGAILRRLTQRQTARPVRADNRSGAVSLPRY